MKLIPLLGQPLKSDQIVDLLESQDLDVVYEFDRLHENAPDSYSASCPELGFELSFDDAQLLKTIFLHARPGEGVSVFDFSGSDVETFASPDLVAAAGQRGGAEVVQGEAEFLGDVRQWTRLDFATHAAHYEFVGGALVQVTVSQTPWEPSGFLQLKDRAE